MCCFNKNMKTGVQNINTKKYFTEYILVIEVDFIYKRLTCYYEIPENWKQTTVVQSNCQKFMEFEEHPFMYKSLSLSLLETSSQTCKDLNTVTNKKLLILVFSIKLQKLEFWSKKTKHSVIYKYVCKKLQSNFFNSGKGCMRNKE